MLVTLVLSSLVVGGVAWIVRGSSSEARARRGLGQRAVSVRDAPAGKLIKLVGRVRYAGPPLRAPLSGRPVACYRITVEGVDGYTLVDTSGSDFVVEDDTGAAGVAWAGVALTVEDDWETRELTPTLDALAARHGRAGMRVSRASEAVLVEGQAVTVVGTAQREPDPDPQHHLGYRDSVERLVLRSHGPFTLLVAAVKKVRSPADHLAAPEAT